MVEVTVEAETEMAVTGADIDALATAAQEIGVLGGPLPVLSVGFCPPQKRLARAIKLPSH